ncbi:1a [Malus domestica virus A]|uniref:1a n=1 Tax=Malus domestica virus A TaxID=2664236 RepID=A0A5Q0TYQ1_9CLOS|nr:1a [Malus domestica virus A]QGA73174.1 1a [Malus domestica virus A]
MSSVSSIVNSFLSINNKTQKYRPLNFSITPLSEYGSVYHKQISLELAHLNSSSWGNTLLPKVPLNGLCWKFRYTPRKPPRRRGKSITLCSSSLSASSKVERKRMIGLLRSALGLRSCSFKRIPRQILYEKKSYSSTFLFDLLYTPVGDAGSGPQKPSILGYCSRRQIPTLHSNCAERYSSSHMSGISSELQVDFNSGHFSLQISQAGSSGGFSPLFMSGRIRPNTDKGTVSVPVRYYVRSTTRKGEYSIQSYSMYFPSDQLQQLMTSVVTGYFLKYPDLKYFFSCRNVRKFILPDNRFTTIMGKLLKYCGASDVDESVILDHNLKGGSLPRNDDKLPSSGFNAVKVGVSYKAVLQKPVSQVRQERAPVAEMEAYTVRDVAPVSERKHSHMRVWIKKEDATKNVSSGDKVQHVVSAKKEQPSPGVVRSGVTESKGMAYPGLDRFVKPLEIKEVVMNPNHKVSVVTLKGLGVLEKHYIKGVLKHYIFNKLTGKTFKVFNTPSAARTLFNLTLLNGRFHVDMDALTPSGKAFRTYGRGFCWLDAFAKYGKVIPASVPFSQACDIGTMLSAGIPRSFLKHVRKNAEGLLHFDEKTTSFVRIENFYQKVGMDDLENKVNLNCQNFDVVFEQMSKNVLNKATPRSDNVTFTSVLQQAANKINDWTDRKADLSIYTSLTTKQKRIISDLYPHMKFKFVDTSYSSHPVFTVMRRVTNFSLYKLVGFNNFVDFGGHIPTLIESGATNMHCCSPIVDSRDAKRHVDAGLFLNQSVDIPSQFTICNKLAQECDVKFNRAIMVEVYDMSLVDIAKAMLAHDSLRCDFSLLLPGELLTEFTTFNVLDNGCRIVKRGDLVDYYLGESAEAYSHVLSNLIHIMTDNLVVVDGIAFKKTLENSYGPFRHYSVTKLESFPKGKTRFSTMYDLSNKNLMMVKIPDTNVNGGVSFVDFLVDKSMLMNMIEYSANCVENFNRKGFEHVFSQYRSRKNYVIYNGKVIHEQVDIPPNLVAGFISVIIAEGIRMSEKTHYLAKYTYYSYYAPGIFNCLFYSLKAVWLKAKSCAYDKVLRFLEVIFGEWITKAARESGSRIFEVNPYVFTEQEIHVTNDGEVHQVLTNTFQKFVETNVKLEQTMEDAVDLQKLDEAVNSGGAGRVNFQILSKIFYWVRVLFGPTVQVVKLGTRMFSAFRHFAASATKNLQAAIRSIGRCLGQVPGLLLSILVSPVKFLYYLTTSPVATIKSIFSWLGSLFSSSKEELIKQETAELEEDKLWATTIINAFSSDDVDEVLKVQMNNLILPEHVMPKHVYEYVGIVHEMERVISEDLYHHICLDDTVNSGGGSLNFNFKRFSSKLEHFLTVCEYWAFRSIGCSNPKVYALVKNEQMKMRLTKLKILRDKLNYIDLDTEVTTHNKFFKKLVNYFRKVWLKFLNRVDQIKLMTLPLSKCMSYRCSRIYRRITSDDFKNKLLELFFDGAISMFCTLISQAYSMKFNPIKIVLSPILSTFLKYTCHLFLGTSDPIVPLIASSLIMGESEVSKNKLALVVGSYFQFKTGLCETFSRTNTFRGAVNDYIAKHNLFSITKYILKVLTTEFGIFCVCIIGFFNLNPQYAMLLVVALLVYQRFYSKLVNISNVAISLNQSVSSLQPIGNLKKALKTVNQMKFKNDNITRPSTSEDDPPPPIRDVIVNKKDTKMVAIADSIDFIVDESDIAAKRMKYLAMRHKYITEKLQCHDAQVPFCPDEQLSQVKKESDVDIVTPKEYLCYQDDLSALEENMDVLVKDRQSLEKYRLAFGVKTRVDMPTPNSLKKPEYKVRKPIWDLDEEFKTVPLDENCHEGFDGTSQQQPNNGKGKCKIVELDAEEPVRLSNPPITDPSAGSSFTPRAENVQIAKGELPGSIVVPPKYRDVFCDFLNNYPVSRSSSFVNGSDDVRNSILEFAHIETANLSNNLGKLERAIHLYGLGHVELRALQVQVNDSELYFYPGFGEWRVLSPAAYTAPKAVNYCVDLEKVLQTFPRDGHKVLFSSKDFEVGYSNMKLKSLDRFKFNFSPISNDRLVQCELINKPPGSGKTTEICDRMVNMINSNRTVLALTVTRVGKAELIAKLKEKNVPRCDSLVKTLDGFLVSKRVCAVEHLFVDECYMAHSGEILAVISMIDSRRISLYGDVNQIPYICRLPHFQARYANTVFKRMTPRYDAISYRCPADVCMILSTTKDSTGRLIYPNGVKAVKNERLRTMNNVPIHGIESIPKDDDATYVTFTVSERDELNKFFKWSKVKTANEIQGGTFSKVYLVRLRTYNNPLYEDVNQFVTSISRHTETFNYYVPYNVMGDKVSAITSGLNNIADHVIAQFGFRQCV